MHLIRTLVRRYMLTGMLVLIPIFLTGWVLRALMRWTDRALALIPPAYRPENLLGFNIPGLGLILTLSIVIVIGALVANVIGKSLLSGGERLLRRIPLIRWFYFSSKQMMEAILMKDEDSFRRAVVVEYPRKGIYSIGFVTAEAKGQLDYRVPGRCYTVFVPTTPNPTSGYLVVVPESEMIPIDWTVDEAFRMIISAGVLMPGEARAEAVKAAEAAVAGDPPDEEVEVSG
ncbi:MAG: DUF502 domain-containing protein [bacterium]|nr:MAG: DUF502 domain-containing protein [bacterium]